MSVDRAPDRRATTWLGWIRASHGIQRGMVVTGLAISAAFVAIALFAPLIAPYGYSQLRDSAGLFGTQHAPSAAHWWGTTAGGFDVFSRVVWGTRTALAMIVSAIVLSILVGVGLGLTAGYFGGWYDRVLVVIADAIYALPALLLAIVMTIVISGGQSDLVGGVSAAAISLTVVFIPQYFRVVRAETLRVKNEPFVDAAKLAGTPTFTIMRKHILRNSTRSIPLLMTLNASEAILTLAALGFLGFGIEPTAGAEWGYDLNRAVADVSSGIWWTSVFPGSAIVLLAVGLTLLGEGLNDLSDPRLRLRRATSLKKEVP